MTHVHSGSFTWPFLFLFAIALGCGGSDEPPASSEEETPAPVAPKSIGDFADPGEMQPEMGTEAEDFPRVEFQTTAGNFTVKLDRTRAPNTVDNFLRYVAAGFYEDTIFHEVTPEYAVVGGGFALQPDGSVLEKIPDYVGVTNEAQGALLNQRGTIAMARALQDADSAKCQFFFNLRDNVELDYVAPKEGVDTWQTAGYCAFGTVEGDGLAILDKIAAARVISRDEFPRLPEEPVKINAIRKL